MGHLNLTAWVRAFHCNNVFITHFQSMKVPTAIKTHYNMAEIKSLIDSWVTHNFIHPRFIQVMKLRMRRLDIAKRLYCHGRSQILFYFCVLLLSRDARDRGIVHVTRLAHDLHEHPSHACDREIVVLYLDTITW